jgi:DNA-binding MarR family transcriptional regulator
MSTANEETGHSPQLGALIRLAAQVMSEELARWIADSGYEGIQPAHSAVIQPLWAAPEGARITDLAQISRITKQSMSALVADLEEGGYVERVADPDDARAQRVRLTARGRAYGRAVRAFATRLEAAWAARVGEQRIAQLRVTLELLRTSVFQGEPAPPPARAPNTRARRSARR